MYSILIRQSAKALTPLALAVRGIAILSIFFNYMDYGHLHFFETHDSESGIKKCPLKNQLLQKLEKYTF